MSGSDRISRLAVLLCAATSIIGGSTAVALATRAGRLSTNRGCYRVGETVHLSGNGFAASRSYVVTIDDVYLGKRTTNAQGQFTVPIHPGGLPSGTAQHVDRVEVSDGQTTAQATITVTRAPGARVLTGAGNPKALRGRFQVWGFSMSGSPAPVYVHYVGPSGRARKTVALGHTGGQCGYLKSARRRVFPLSVSPGTWTMQIDTVRGYARHPGGPVARIRVTIS